jgi:hypothetical protein
VTLTFWQVAVVYFAGFLTAFIPACIVLMDCRWKGKP